MNSPNTHTTHNGTADANDSDSVAADDAQQRASDPPTSLDEAWATIAVRIAELREYAGYYVAANIDRLRLTGRTAVMWAVLPVAVGLIVTSIIAAASVMLLVGLAAGIGELFGGRMWAGQLAVSATTLLAASGGVWLILRRGVRTYERAMIEKYELRKKEERSEYGTDVERRAKERSPIA